MEVLIEILFEFLGEVLIQVLFEAFAEFGVHFLREGFRKAPNAWVAAIGYACLGAIAGGLSLWAFPALFMASHTGRLANLVLAPIVAGAAMVIIGAWRRRRDQDVIRLDRFAYGYLFALAMAAVRFGFGK